MANLGRVAELRLKTLSDNYYDIEEKRWGDGGEGGMAGFSACTGALSCVWAGGKYARSDSFKKNIARQQAVDSQFKVKSFWKTGENLVATESWRKESASNMKKIAKLRKKATGQSGEKLAKTTKKIAELRKQQAVVTKNLKTVASAVKNGQSAKAAVKVINQTAKTAGTVAQNASKFSKVLNVSSKGISKCGGVGYFGWRVFQEYGNVKQTYKVLGSEAGNKQLMRTGLCLAAEGIAYGALAAKGAAIGATVGSAIPVVGTAIGAVVGALIPIGAAFLARKFMQKAVFPKTVLEEHYDKISNNTTKGAVNDTEEAKKLMAAEAVKLQDSDRNDKKNKKAYADLLCLTKDKNLVGWEKYIPMFLEQEEETEEATEEEISAVQAQQNQQAKQNVQQQQRQQLVSQAAKVDYTNTLKGLGNLHNLCLVA